MEYFGDGAVFFEPHSDDVKSPYGRYAGRQRQQIGVGGARKCGAFSAREGIKPIDEGRFVSGAHLDKHQARPIAGDDIQFAAADTAIAHYNFEAAFAQEIFGRIFAEAASFASLRLGRRRAFFLEEQSKPLG